MTIDSGLLKIILVSAVIMFSFRYIPQIFLNFVNIPPRVYKFLFNLPIAMLTAMAFQSVFLRNGTLHSDLDYFKIAGLVTSIILAIKTKNLAITLFGSIAILLVLSMFGLS